MLKRLLGTAIVLGVIWWLMLGLTDRQIDAFQTHRRAVITQLQAVGRTVVSTWKKI